MKTKLFFFCAVSIGLQSCNNKQLTEVTVPLPEYNKHTTVAENPDNVANGIKGTFKITKLPIKYEGLEPKIKAHTIKFHYAKIFANYTNSFNQIATQFNISNKTAFEINTILDSNNSVLRNNSGGYYNHNLYFETLTNKKINLLDGDFKNAILSDFGSLENLKNIFISTAKEQFGSGWTWLILDQNNKLQIVNTENEDNPLMNNATIKGKPLLCIDLWEHAYLGNDISKSQYIDMFFDTVNWDVVMRRYQATIK